ncbi:MAG TPA: class I SAM-dependent methyltransferase [Candidatus Tumulicola sp.]|jgi:SAM-dependent methyltransferase
MAPLTEHALKNLAHWERQSDDYEARHSDQLSRHPMAWGCWSVPESELSVLDDVAGKDVLELGCGAARWSIALAKCGARVVGLDISERQLAHARRYMSNAGVEFPLVRASAEAVPLATASFDIVFCDHGAMTFCDPYLTVPEAGRLLRRGGLLAFSAATPILNVCWNDADDRVDDRLHANYFERRRFEDAEAVNFSLPYGDWIALFRRNGFVIEDLIELRPPSHARTTYTDYAPIDWARAWPAEQIWRVRKD